MIRQLFGTQHEVSEWVYRTNQHYGDPFNDLELDAVITGPDGQTWQVPAYWSGGREWRIRFAPPQPGAYRVATVCTQASDPDLHGQTALLEAQPYTGSNQLRVHGRLRVAATRRTLEHADGTPFFWLGDTWWMGLCQRLRWPEEFQRLTADRVAKGFSLVQIVAGLYPDMPGFDPRGANEAGFPWEADYARISPAYFDQADMRIAWLVHSGLVPCIVGSWGYYLPLLGLAKIKQHWRNLVARWGAYPVVWCLAGEGAMPYYLSADKEADVQTQVHGWIEVGRYIRTIDPFRNPLGLHSAPEISDLVHEEQLLDVNLMQPGHGTPETLAIGVSLMQREYAHLPPMPALIAEVSYEGILHNSSAEVQRLAFWTAWLSGAAGHTYGANGLWQLNRREQPYGPSPHGASWGGPPWDEAAQLPGAVHLGRAKRLLERYPWWRFEPHPEWVDPCGSPDHLEWPFAAGIPGEVRVIYMYGPNWSDTRLTVKALTAGAPYTAFFWDPRTGAEHPLGTILAADDGTWAIPVQPEASDWVLVLEG